MPNKEAFSSRLWSFSWGHLDGGHGHLAGGRLAGGHGHLAGGHLAGGHLARVVNLARVYR